MDINETVAAISTPHGTGGISVIRVSGEDAVNIASRVFVPASGKPLLASEHARARYGKIYSRGKVIDDGIAVVFYAPRSYTGENVVEISCHGGILLTNRVLEAIFSAGAVPAPAGEFTRRAFLSGKLTLSEAEAVGDRLYARTDAQLSLASPEAAGRVSRAVSDIAERIMSLISSLSAVIDYPDEELTETGRGDVSAECEKIGSSLTSLLATYDTGRAVTLGIDAAIVGRPNAGKSTLFNLFAGCERAIVTNIAGTTRDVITEDVSVDGVMLHISDTAGVRGTDDEIEALGVRRARAAAAGAELVIIVIDAADENTPADVSADLSTDVSALLDELDVAGGDRTSLAVINKTDEASPYRVEKIKKALDLRGISSVEASLLRGEGFDEIKRFIKERFTDGELSLSEDAIISNARISAEISAAADGVISAGRASSSGMPADIVITELESAYGALMRADGREVTTAVVDEIFGKFCVGK
ncbi:MAG: tRNA uridine-5-carboxymethylaminomethyl(34) synthesis GTPase MnmE [Clostridia bacterium]|nr:tRNA uridine-5-carboxymethylaminomethyl(34) synthesis GTPase MnmE [Clostridia bacterium]